MQSRHNMHALYYQNTVIIENKLISDVTQKQSSIVTMKTR